MLLRVFREVEGTDANPVASPSSPPGRGVPFAGPYIIDSTSSDELNSKLYEETIPGFFFS